VADNETMITANIALIAFFGGLFPSLLWLWFWLREEHCHHNPKRYILAAFIGGMVAVPLVLPLQHLAATYFSGVIVVILWAAAEEVLKFLAAYVTVLRPRMMDAPIDPLIFMISTALGFAALENAFFLIDPIRDGGTVQALLTGNLRFIGATLLHTLTSATVGFGVAYAFYRRKFIQRWVLALSLVLAIALHSIFNFLIIEGNQGGMMQAFLFVWAGIILLLLLFEKVKARSNTECTF